MAILPTRSSTDLNSAADINALSTKALDKTEMTAKGDLLVATASGAYAKLVKGTDGKVLTAKASETTGLSWETPTAETFPATKITVSTSAASGTPADKDIWLKV